MLAGFSLVTGPPWPGLSEDLAAGFLSALITCSEGADDADARRSNRRGEHHKATEPSRKKSDKMRLEKVGNERRRESDP